MKQTHGRHVTFRKQTLLPSSQVYPYSHTKVEQFFVNGNEIDSIATFLIGASAWFAITPLPDDQWCVDVKPDIAPRLEKFIDRPYRMGW